MGDLNSWLALPQSVLHLEVNPVSYTHLDVYKRQLHHKNPTGLVDHFAIGVENFNKESVTEKLKERGITPEENLDAGFHIKDPEGMNVQIVPA